MAALELLRHGEITTEQAAEFAGVSRDQLTGLLRKLAISADM
jgi:hypothetical protein